MPISLGSRHPVAPGATSIGGLTCMARSLGCRWPPVRGMRRSVQLAVFEEVYRILKLCWADEAFSYEGEFYKVPSPYAGCLWLATTTMGASRRPPAPQGLVVPKPYQKPHPKLFQAFSLSESTVVVCAEGITPVMLISYPELARRNAQAHFEAAQQAWPADIKEPGNDMGGIRQIYIGNSRQEARTGG